MKKTINWKAFFILSAACVVGSALVIPFQTVLTRALAEIDTKLLYLSALLQGVIIFPGGVLVVHSAFCFGRYRLNF